MRTLAAAFVLSAVACKADAPAPAQATAPVVAAPAPTAAPAPVQAVPLATPKPKPVEHGVTYALFDGQRLEECTDSYVEPDPGKEDEAIESTKTMAAKIET